MSLRVVSFAAYLNHERCTLAGRRLLRFNVCVIRATLKANAQIARFVGTAGSDDSFPSQVHKVYEELTGKNLAALKHEPDLAREDHARSHGSGSASSA